MSSTRLPGKVLKPILGCPMLELQLERISRCKYIDQLVVATSEDQTDQPIVDLCENIGVAVFRGDLDNVLNRFYLAACKYNPDHIVRLTGDCPLADPELIDDLIAFYLREKCDYASNCRPPTLPDGLDAEIFSFRALEIAWQNSKGPYELEHVVPYIIRHPERFSIANLKNNDDLSQFRWTVDEIEDFELVKQIYDALYDKNRTFTTSDILTFLEKNPRLKTHNTHLKRNFGAEKAKQAEKVLSESDIGHSH